MDPVRRVTAPTVDVLELLLAQTEPLSGLLLAKKTGRTPAAVDAILARLVNRGWVEAAWKNLTRNGSPRRLYELTDAGRSGAEATVAEHRAQRSSDAELKVPQS